MLNYLILAVVQGLTEFLPVSSSAHLLLIQRLMGQKEIGLTYDLILHLGTLIAVVILYWRELFTIILSFVRPRSIDPTEAGKYRALLYYLVIGTITTFLLIFPFRQIRENLTNSHETSILPVIAALLVTASFLWLMAVFIRRERSGVRANGIEDQGQESRNEGLLLRDQSSGSRPSTRKGVFQLGYMGALIVGAAQGVSGIFPGISRSGSTIFAGYLAGLDRAEAARYSFLLSIPAILGAALFDIVGKGSKLELDLLPMLFSLVLSALSGILAIKVLIRIILKWDLRLFSLYIFLFCLVIYLIWLGGN